LPQIIDRALIIAMAHAHMALDIPGVLRNIVRRPIAGCRAGVRFGVTAV
jgi:hypothetical protein